MRARSKTYQYHCTEDGIGWRWRIRGSRTRRAPNGRRRDGASRAEIPTKPVQRGRARTPRRSRALDSRRLANATAMTRAAPWAPSSPRPDPPAGANQPQT
ncbi:hypothetical protein GUJ93_ZPchr0007g5486 [Zizania palustris]|uniref:Uncharacterized protein n=1 Tax=Zizania palustris TaxID=103762 RepID=A0A8J5SJG5_ZIZPA|nr:hypothetical protein GUJ93_ZPchr0007g5486 [Zizania palustris]